MKNNFPLFVVNIFRVLANNKSGEMKEWMLLSGGISLRCLSGGAICLQNRNSTPAVNYV